MRVLVRNTASEKGWGQEESLWNYNIHCHVGKHGSGAGGQQPRESAVKSNTKEKVPVPERVPTR